MAEWKKVLVSGSSAALTSLSLDTVVNADTDTDKFLVLDGSGNVDFRTGAQVLSDIGAGTGGGDITAVTAGDGLSGGATTGAATLAVSVDDTSIEITDDSLNIKASGVTNAMLAGSIAASKLAGSIGNAKLSNSSVNFGGVSVSLGGSDTTPAFDLTDATNYPASSLSGTITNSQLAGSIANAKLANSAITINGSAISLGGSVTITDTNTMGSGFVLEDGDGTEVTVTENKEVKFVEGGGIDINWTDTSNGSDTDPYDLTFKVASGGVTNDMLAGSIANGKLTNSAVSFGGISLSLGGEDATPAFDLSDATNYPASSLSGTITNSQLAGSIANGKLSNSAITIAGQSTSLGGSISADTIAENIGSSVITSGQLAGSIANAKLANSSITINGSAIALGGSVTTPDTNTTTTADVKTALNADFGGDFTIGNQSDDTCTITGNLTVGANLTVSGTTTTVDTANLSVEDQFIELHRGASSNGDGGIVVNGNSINRSFGWDNSEGRWAFDFTGASASQTAITSDAFAAAVVTSDDSNYRKNGNIRVESSEIYIYVE